MRFSNLPKTKYPLNYYRIPLFGNRYAMRTFLEYNQIIIKITTITIKDKPMLLSINLLFAFLVLLIGALMLLVKG